MYVYLCMLQFYTCLPGNNSYRGHLNLFHNRHLLDCTAVHYSELHFCNCILQYYLHNTGNLTPMFCFHSYDRRIQLSLQQQGPLNQMLPLKVSYRNLAINLKVIIHNFIQIFCSDKKQKYSDHFDYGY